MELDDLKSDWKNLTPDPRTTEDLHRMIHENSHPVLKGIKWQMIFETTLFTLLLLVYYSGFDGDQKPFYANFLLVTAVLLVILHNVLGYLSVQNMVTGSDLRESLKNYLARVRRYAIVSVSSRVVAMTCLLLFFSSTVSFSGIRLLALLGVLLVISVQVYVLARIWKERIRSLNTVLRQLSEQ